jgi:uncharacterized protein (UPF0335 family)
MYVVKREMCKKGLQLLCVHSKWCELANNSAAYLTVSARLTKVLSAAMINSEVPSVTPMSSFKSTIEKIRALETERKNLLLEIEELKRMADAKAKALESEINMLRDEVKSLRTLLSGEEQETDLGQKKKK